MRKRITIKNTYYPPGTKFTGFDELKDLVDNGTTTLYVPTTKEWKCKRNNCTSKFKHGHSTYAQLKIKK